jgi:hypothetical protein
LNEHLQEHKIAIMTIIDLATTFVTQRSLAEAIGLILFIAFARFLWGDLDSREPPALRSRIPLIGHLIGLIRFGPYHLPKLGSVKPSPMHMYFWLTCKQVERKTYSVSSNTARSVLCRLGSDMRADIAKEQEPFFLPLPSSVHQERDQL